MKLNLLSPDDFRAAIKDGKRPEGMVCRLASSDPDVTDETRTARFVFSDASIDLSGDSIEQDGWELDDFKANSVALFSHMSWEPPIGRASNVKVKGGKLIGDIEFASADMYPFADTIFRLVKGGFLKAVSVGFMPIEYEYAQDKERPYGLNFIKQKLLEISVCCVPCNPNALNLAKSKGIDTAPLREWASKVLDSGGANVLVPREFLEETFRQAKTPRALRQKFLAKAQASEWKVGAVAELAVVDVAWDGPAAAKRMLDAAGFDGETPDVTKAAQGFLVHDAGNPTMRSSYKLPFADVVDGALKAVKEGVQAAASRLQQEDAAAGVIDQVKELVAGYDAKIAALRSTGGEMPPGSCGRAADVDCGMKDPMECAVHAAPPEKTNPTPEVKAGRRISTANEAMLRKAMDHHASATECIKGVLDSNAAADDQDEADPNDLEIPLIEEDDVAKRVRATRELLASLPK